KIKISNCGIYKSQGGIVVNAFESIVGSLIEGYSAVSLVIEKTGSVGQTSGCFIVYYNPIVVRIVESATSDSGGSGIDLKYGSKGYVKDCFGSNNNGYGAKVLYNSNIIYSGTIPSGNSGNTYHDGRNSFIGS
ncbi:MAG: hypothetical protein JRI44_11705, partial [Deltaproteobacteria bacterium]|nr:hypothetical protein [Deltaproteobacteria bacterium]